MDEFAHRYQNFVLALTVDLHESVVKAVVNTFVVVPEGGSIFEVGIHCLLLRLLLHR